VKTLILEALTPDQLAAAVAFDQLCFGGFWTLEGYQRELESPNSELLGLRVPTSTPANHSLVGLGCLWAIVDEAHITLLAVHPDYRQQGLGQVLLLGLLSAAYQRGLERATLEVRVSNSSAIALYQKFGFQTAGHRRRYYSDPEEDALLLWRGGLQTQEFNQFLIQKHQQIQAQWAEKGWELVEAMLLRPV
jgi:[ribosomal protein S18]-alanine N-acetyltransferase